MVGNQYRLPFSALPDRLSFPGDEMLAGIDANVSKIFVNLALEYHEFPACMYRGPEFGMDPTIGFDCSGYVLFLIKEVQKKVPALLIPEGIRHANEMFEHLGVAVHRDVILPGDLVFYSRRGQAVKHVGIYIGKASNGIPYVIHSPGYHASKVEIITLEDTFIPRIFERQIYTSHLAGFKRLKLGRDTRSYRWTQRPIY